MIQLKLISGFLMRCLAGIVLIQMVGCANIVPPSGGPRDSIPPYAVYAKPEDSRVQSRYGMGQNSRKRFLHWLR